ncbi:MAG: bifunctional (p)ppGpp synthetase/guanosine-3',5'-bis(diphosphate) 3'-pyrophosphohydrolase [Lachnospiraceae bacterium]|nr:bifunctional (p)ppGpp synthetase/guanosine-3',5'-bis(diphosphate) 3'-pyrophosphohydrolase [Lachnospiraceae bacterium]
MDDQKNKDMIPAAETAEAVGRDERSKLATIQETDNPIQRIQDMNEPDRAYENLIKTILEYHPSTDTSMIEKAYRLAKGAHEGQFRKSGEPYIIHPLAVALILADLELDKETVVAGLLHDVVEDTIITTDEIAVQFGEEVAVLVDGVTKLGKLPYARDKLEIQAENLRKMFLAMAKDIRVIMIKLADRLHNMRTLEHMTPEKQIEKARETMDIYAPLASRLGISKIKVELDDLALKYIEPAQYQKLSEELSLKKSSRDRFIEGIVEDVKQNLEKFHITGTVYGRVKHLFSIYKKMLKQHKTLDEIYDLFAVRVIVDTNLECYETLGALHAQYTSIPGRFKDYISVPKPNKYQSLHTTLIAKNGQQFEVQIRTMEMHRTAEFGIAAHWKYKESGGSEATKADREEEKISWLREILEWQKEMDNQEFLSLLKSDLNLFNESVYCFTPNGEVRTLPAGSTPIDFAYSIHSAVGNRMVGAKVNRKLVTIDYQLQTGDTIEILTSQNSRGPSLDWLKICKSTQAKNKISQWFKSQRKDDHIAKGKELLASYCKSKGYVAADLMKPKYMEAVMRKYGFRDWDSILAGVGHGGLREGQVINKMMDLYKKEHAAAVTDAEVLAKLNENQEESWARNLTKDGNRKTKSDILFRGHGDMAYRLSGCCNPVRGDEIVGYITKGRGITVHRTDCVNMMHLTDSERERLIEAEWSAQSAGTNVAEIKIYCNNRTGLVVDISKEFSERNIDIMALSTLSNKRGMATITVKFRVNGKDELRSIISKIRQIESVIDIERTAG